MTLNIPAVVRRKVSSESAKMLKSAAQVETASQPGQIAQQSTKCKSLKPTYSALINYNLPERQEGEDDASDTASYQKT